MYDLKGKNVMVTGASGFTGYHLCNELVKEGANIIAFVRGSSDINGIKDLNGVKIVYGDMTDISSIYRAIKYSNTEFVFNCAAVVPVMGARDIPMNTVAVNTQGVFNLSWICSELDVKRIVQISTCHIYGNHPESELPLTEEATPTPEDIYSSSKFSGEIMLKHFINNGLDAVITRAFNLFGAKQRSEFFIPEVIKQVAEEKKKELVVGNITTTRDYTYAPEIVRGYIMAMKMGKVGNIYQFCSGNEIKMSALIDKIIEALNEVTKQNYQPEIISRNPRKNDINRMYGTYKKAKNEFGWEPEISLEDGLRKTISETYVG
ncbi:MAG: GDP-mannose 4,6-dehydratase [Candidatus Aenigmarchaeota archaeon]|nr:GDP-mannose 4,6-dehydratase [Candidatus Aenigmarchaeota archaeon]